MEVKFYKGDILILSKEHISHFVGGSLTHPIGTKFIAYSDCHNTGTIVNLNNSISYFAFGEFMDKLVNLDRWRDLQINNILSI